PRTAAGRWALTGAAAAVVGALVVTAAVWPRPASRPVSAPVEWAAPTPTPTSTPTAGPTPDAEPAPEATVAPAPPAGGRCGIPRPSRRRREAPHGRRAARDDAALPRAH